MANVVEPNNITDHYRCWDDDDYGGGSGHWYTIKYGNLEIGYVHDHTESFGDNGFVSLEKIDEDLEALTHDPNGNDSDSDDEDSEDDDNMMESSDKVIKVKSINDIFEKIGDFWDVEDFENKITKLRELVKLSEEVDKEILDYKHLNYGTDEQRLEVLNKMSIEQLQKISKSSDKILSRLAKKSLLEKIYLN